MANSIALATNYLPILDEIYKKEACTSALERTDIRWLNAQTVELFKTSLEGLGTYGRNTGYVSGSVTGTWEALQLTQDRGRSFSVDAMDDEETIGMAFGTLAAEFLRTKVIPEVDAYRFAKMSAGAGTIASADITVGTTDCVGLIDAAEQELLEAEVKKDGCILYVSPKMYSGIKAKITRKLTNEMAVERNIEVFDEMPVVVVPQSRFYTAITLKTGSEAGDTSGGYIGTASTGYNVNFMIVDPKAVIAVTKQALPRIFSPQENQTADAWKFDYRIYHDCFVEANKTKGVYLHKSATALS